MLKGFARMLMFMGAAGVIFAFLLCGCGRKAPPVPPLRETLNAVHPAWTIFENK
jgi:hypothetical protein